MSPRRNKTNRKTARGTHKAVVSDPRKKKKKKKPKKKKPVHLDVDQNDAVREVLRQLKETRTQVELANEIGCSQALISGFLAGTRNVGWPNAIAICEVAGADVFQVLGIDRPAGTKYGHIRHMDAADFLLRYHGAPGLSDWVAEQRNRPNPITVAELVRAIDVWRSATTYPRTPDNQPRGGWDKFFADLRAGKFDPAPRAKDAAPDRES